MMIDKQTIKDLEFFKIQELISGACVQPSAKEKARDITPYYRQEEADKELSIVSELLAIKEEEHSSFPRLEFEELNQEIKVLRVKNSTLDKEGIIRIFEASMLINSILTFFKKREDEFNHLRGELDSVFDTDEIILAIEQIFDKRFEVKDDASKELFEIRNQIKSTRKQINRNFERVLKKYQGKGYLGDTQESYLQGRRVLSVVANYKRVVNGRNLGTSKSGHLSYIEPQENLLLNSQLEKLEDEERSEIFRILKALTGYIQQFYSLIKAYNQVLIRMDFIQAKVKFAQRIKGVQPKSINESHIDLIDAVHPLLYLMNFKEKKKTLPQSILMNKFSRMLVISGPNAGGKSITLKTVGLLQLMYQSGIPVPLNPNSTMGWFNSILSDIGDNQSIENELSTYSYRLKRMNQFLKEANKRTLLLLDEFGTGSDPELGGALAEVFFETLYNKKSFGVITTHYANIKLKASILRNAVNASMLFDTETLRPLYKLSIGQPGSSFTFEGAKINGIPDEIIEKAKKRLDVNRVKMDRLLSELQKEKHELEQARMSFRIVEEKTLEAEGVYLKQNKKLEEKIQQNQKQTEKNNKLIKLGEKYQGFIAKYQTKDKKKNKQLLQELAKHIAIEKNKQEESKKLIKLKIEEGLPKKKKKNKPKKKKREKPIKVGSQVRLKQGGKQIGEVLEIENNVATVLFGLFKTKVELDKLYCLKM